MNASSNRHFEQDEVLQLGVCFYPEHWPEETWQTDAHRMKELGLNLVRVGEFAWSRIEPRSGEIRLDWLDRAIDTLAEAGLGVVLGTPTATPPKWLVDRYDDVLPVDREGRRRGFGSRRHYCFNSPSYRLETERIVTLLAERYGGHDALKAWQTDNEYGGHDTVRCYCRNCGSAFRRWLQERYGEISVLNDAWWNAFWSMEYREFAEIELPNLTVAEPNPSHSLDYYRFASDSVVQYNRLQVAILRRLAPDRPITHNALISFGDFDHYKLSEDLDFISWDNYPLGMLERSGMAEELKIRFMRTGHPDLIGFNHDLFFGMKRRPFWVMEQQPGQVNWAVSNPLPEPGMVRLWSHQAFAHGAQAVSFFRWRAAQGAQELMHAGLLTHAGTPDRVTEEVRSVATEIEGARSGRRRAHVALLFDYENLWATNLQPHAQGWDYWALQHSYYGALRGLGLDVDIVPSASDLRGYEIVFAPALHLVDDRLAGDLAGYVEQGGHLLLGPRSGFKTPSNTAHAPAPGPLRTLVGAHVDGIDAIRPGVMAELSLAGERFEYQIWADLLIPTTASVLAEYRTGSYRGAAALTRQTFGNGECTLLGAWGSDELHRQLFRSLAMRAGLAVLDLPDEVRLASRGNRSYLMNFGAAPASVAGLPGRKGPVEVPAHGLLLFEPELRLETDE